jgi:hypothetical protein
MKLLSNLKYIFLLIGFTVTSVAMSDSGNSSNEQAKNMSLEEKLVFLDTGHIPQIKDTKVARVRTLLDTLKWTPLSRQISA